MLKRWLDTREFHWALKQRCCWSPPLRRKRGVAGIAPLSRLNHLQQERLAQLQAEWLLDDWPTWCTAREYCENLYLLDLLAQQLPRPIHGGRGLDVGCRNFCHLPALSAFLPGAWDGVELDAHARYWSGHTRRAVGEWMAGQRADCRYLAGSVLALDGRYDLVTWILPFVLPGALAHWGLPQRYFEPERLLAHVAGLLTPGGLLFIVNQGEAEAAGQQSLFLQQGLAAVALGPQHSVFSPFRQPRFGWLLRKDPASQAQD